MKTIILLSHVGFDNTPYCSYVHSHAKALVKAGYKVIVFASLRWFPGISLIRKNRKEKYKKYKGEQIIDGVHVIYFKNLSISNFLQKSNFNVNGWFYFQAVKKKIKKIIEKEDVLFIDAHTFKIEGYVAAKLKKIHNIPATVTCHGTSFNVMYQTENGKKQIKKICDSLDYVIGVSERFKEKLNAICVNNVKVIYNGINYYVEQKNEKNRKENGLIIVSALRQQKNIDLLIKAFANIYIKDKDATLTIVGEGKEKQNLVQLCTQLKLNNAVHFKGQISNSEVYELLRKNNIFVLPSVREGFGIAYAEAMYNGCITIGTKHEGIDGFIVNGKNGYLIEPNVEEITQKIYYILDKNNKEECERTRMQGIKDASKLTWKKNVTKYLALIEGKEDIYDEC